MSRSARAEQNVIIGGCGFIGSNLADSLLADGEHVTVVDNLRRPGVDQNLAWLKQRHGRQLKAKIADIRAPGALERIVSDAKAIFHFAAQTAVTTSLGNPIADFEINARGTLNLLEAVRRAGCEIPVIFASTNKVYGSLANVATSATRGFHLPRNRSIRAHGIGETQPLEFSTPYGCSKGVADQYVIDYAHSYGLRTAVLRMSCIYGPRQFGTEDQGWVAHFLLNALSRRPITIFGDGRQVRDILHVSDTVAAYRAAMDNVDRVQGRAFNLGGGPPNAVSLKNVLSEISRITGHEPDLRHAEPRTGDQLYFVSDTRAIQNALGWRPEIDWRRGLEELAVWLTRFRLQRRLLGKTSARSSEPGESSTARESRHDR
jgi:CDP-paratose 2-epimerase